MVYKTLEVKQEGQIAWLTLNRPRSLNAMNTALAQELRDFLGTLPARKDIRVVIMRGAGRAFCAGLDLKELSSGAPIASGDAVGSGFDLQRRTSTLVIGIRRAPQPFIAAIRGAACGGGLALALACDTRIAGESARFNAAFVRVGVSACDMGLSYFLPRAVGSSVAAELMLTGRFISAQRALATGLVSEVVPDSEVDSAASRLAQEMLEVSPLGLRLTKECLWSSVDASSLEHAIQMEDRNQVLCMCAGHMREGVRAYIENRRPNYPAEG